MNNLICIAGPTASGKTALSIALAKVLNGEIVSCDSMQVYKRMNIGTAKPTPEEMEGIPHHMLSVAEPWEDFSVGKYCAMAAPIVDDILERGKTAIIVGGTGLYMDALIRGNAFAPVPSTGCRERLEAQAEQEGIESILQQLRQVDPESAQRLHPSDKKRIIRAMEVYLETGQTITSYINYKRVLHAMHLLSSTNLQVQTIALHCGIMDVQYFSKIFKKQVGISPLKYRKASRN